MTLKHIIPDNPLRVTIDISKHRYDILVYEPGKSRKHKLKITNTSEDMDRLIVMLTAYDRPVSIRFEATGNYHQATITGCLLIGLDKLDSTFTLYRQYRWQERARPCTIVGIRTIPRMRKSSCI